MLRFRISHYKCPIFLKITFVIEAVINCYEFIFVINKTAVFNAEAVFFSLFSFETKLIF